MALADYTTNSAIRLLLGVADDELDDTMLAEQTVLDNLQIELADIDAGLDAAYQGIKDASDTAPKKDLCAKMRLFATSAVAVQFLPTLPLLAPRTITHDKDMTQRNLDAYKDTQARVRDAYDRYKLRLQQAYVAYQGQKVNTPTLRVMLAAGNPASDPVTGA